jgi:hypothetical protein
MIFLILIIAIIYWSLIFLFQKYKVFKIIDYHIIYIHEKGHQKIFALFGVKTNIKNIVLKSIKLADYVRLLEVMRSQFLNYI